MKKTLPVSKRISRLLKSGMLLLLLLALSGFWQAAAAQYITVQNGNFYNGAQQWFPYGFNYVPYYAFQGTANYAEFWLGDGYRPEVIEAELTTLNSLGVNCLTVIWASNLVISKVELQVGDTGPWFEVRDGMAYAVPARQKINCRAKVVNMGDATWLTNVAFAANPGKLAFSPLLLNI